jgi:hypothetical protein
MATYSSLLQYEIHYVVQSYIIQVLGHVLIKLVWVKMPACTSGTEWDRMGQNGTEWDRMGQGGIGWDRMGQDGTGWDRMGERTDDNPD